jgi:uncharacterized RmlC-like cupin family protein
MQGPPGFTGAPGPNKFSGNQKNPEIWAPPLSWPIGSPYHTVQNARKGGTGFPACAGKAPYGGDSMAEVQFIDLSGEIKADARGMSFFPWQGRLQKSQVLLTTFHLVSIRPSQTRGNHLHPGQAEWLYPFHGAGVIRWEAAPGQVRERVVQGDRTLIYIAPGLAHALTNPGPEILYLLAWREAAGTATATEPETVPHPVGG